MYLDTSGLSNLMKANSPHAGAAIGRRVRARSGEVSAWKWDDIDEARGVIRIRRSHWRGKVTTTKTDSVRTVPLVPELAEALRDHRKMLLARQAKGFADGWVFPRNAGTLRTRRAYANRCWLP